MLYIKEKHPECPIQLIPGVTAISAAAAIGGFAKTAYSYVVNENTTRQLELLQQIARTAGAVTSWTDDKYALKIDKMLAGLNDIQVAKEKLQDVETKIKESLSRVFGSDSSGSSKASKTTNLEFNLSETLIGLALNPKKGKDAVTNFIDSIQQNLIKTEGKQKTSLDWWKGGRYNPYHIGKKIDSFIDTLTSFKDIAGDIGDGHILQGGGAAEASRENEGGSRKAEETLD